MQDSIKETEYVFTVSLQEDKDSEPCSIIAFRLMKDYKPKFKYLKNMKNIVSILVCAMSGSRRYDKRLGVQPVNSYDIKRGVKAISSGLGAVLSYMSAKWAKRQGYQFYIIKAASYALVKIYMGWGFHIGLPFINLDEVVKKKMEEIDAIEHRKVKEEEKEHQLHKVIRNEIQKRLLDSFYFADMIGLTEEYWESERYGMDPFEQECNEMTEYIVKKNDTYTMYIYLEGEDVENLGRYAYDKFYRYNTENGQFVIEDEDFKELF